MQSAEDLTEGAICCRWSQVLHRSNTRNQNGHLRSMRARGELDTNNMMSILQINMRWSATVHELLAEFLAEIKADLLLISEQYRNKNPETYPHDSWVLDQSYPQWKLSCKSWMQFILTLPLMMRAIHQRSIKSMWGEDKPGSLSSGICQYSLTACLSNTVLINHWEDVKIGNWISTRTGL